MFYLSANVSGHVNEIKRIGKLAIAVLQQGDYEAFVKLGNSIQVPEVGAFVSYNGTAKVRIYNNVPQLEYWANEVLA